ncbi:unnamed protein product [Closterium sp. NIES-64]|nr:unnamed protein product [Closterium sp. NIES-64]
MTRPHASSPGVLIRRLQGALTRRILPLAVALTVAYLTFFELVRPNLLSADIAQSSGSPLFPQSGCETARNCRSTQLDRYVYSADAEFGWKDTGNRMRAKEAGGWWTGYVLLVNAHRWLNQTVTNRFLWWHHLTLIAPDNMPNASKGLVLFFIGAGWSDDGKDDSGYHVPKASAVFIRVAAPDDGKDDSRYHVPKANAVFIRVAAPLVVDQPIIPIMGMMGVMLHEEPMPGGGSGNNGRDAARGANDAHSHLGAPCISPSSPLSILSLSQSRLACSLVVDLGIMGVMLHEEPMMPITFHVTPPGISSSRSQKLQEEEIVACKPVTLYRVHNPNPPGVSMCEASGARFASGVSSNSRKRVQGW